MKNVAAMVRLMLTPISWAASRSWAVARIALPSLELLTKVVSTITSTIASAMTIRSLAPIDAEPPREIRPDGSRSGKCTLLAPCHIYIRPSRMNDMPTAVISVANRGALRSGR